MIYNSICTINDVLKERYICGTELVGDFDIPKLNPIQVNLDNFRAVPYNLASKEKKPKECILHFFIDDYRFESVWNNFEKCLETISFFKYACAPDFSVYSNMPKVMQIWQVYRNRALSMYLWNSGINVIPTVTWSDKASYEFCFDGLPGNSTLAVSTNGCHTIKAREYYKTGFKEMCKRLNPYNILVIGGKIDIDTDIPIVYLNGFSQDMTERLKNGR